MTPVKPQISKFKAEKSCQLSSATYSDQNKDVGEDIGYVLQDFTVKSDTD